jgi:hypothetical protein
MLLVHSAAGSVSAVQSGPVFDLFVRTKDWTIGPVRSLGRCRTGLLQDQDRGPVLVQDRSLAEFKKLSRDAQNEQTGSLDTSSLFSLSFQSMSCEPELG